MVDLANGINSTYKFTTKEAIESGELVLDQRFDMIFEATKDLSTPGITNRHERSLGKGFVSGAINPDHRSYLAMSDDLRIFNAGMTLSHEANTHGVANKIEILTGKSVERGMYDGHFSNRGYIDSRVGKKYLLSPEKYSNNPPYGYSALVKNRANAFYALEHYYYHTGIGYNSEVPSPSPFLPSPPKIEAQSLWNVIMLFVNQ